MLRRLSRPSRWGGCGPRRGLPHPLRSAFVVSRDPGGLLLPEPCDVFRSLTSVGFVSPCSLHDAVRGGRGRRGWRGGWAVGCRGFPGEPARRAVQRTCRSRCRRPRRGRPGPPRRRLSSSAGPRRCGVGVRRGAHSHRGGGRPPSDARVHRYGTSLRSEDPLAVPFRLRLPQRSRRVVPRRRGRRGVRSPCRGAASGEPTAEVRSVRGPRRPARVDVAPGMLPSHLRPRLAG